MATLRANKVPGLGTIPEKPEDGTYVEDPLGIMPTREKTFEELVTSRDCLREELRNVEEQIRHRLVHFKLL